MSSVESLYKLTENDIDRASVVLKDAFIDYPTFRYLFPDINERDNKLKSVMIFFLKCGLIQGEVFAPSNKLEGISIWYNSNNLHFGLKRLLKSGLLSTIFDLNINSFMKFKRLGDAKRINRDRLLKKNYYLLDLIGVDPLHEKQGYGRLLIEKMIGKIAKERMSCFLETSDVKNMDYYIKFGFTLIESYKYDNLESYCMIRE